MTRCNDCVLTENFNVFNLDKRSKFDIFARYKEVVSISIAVPVFFSSVIVMTIFGFNPLALGLLILSAIISVFAIVSIFIFDKKRSLNLFFEKLTNIADRFTEVLDPRSKERKNLRGILSRTNSMLASGSFERNKFREFLDHGTEILKELRNAVRTGSPERNKFREFLDHGTEILKEFRNVIRAGSPERNLMVRSLGSIFSTVSEVERALKPESFERRLLVNALGFFTEALARVRDIANPNSQERCAIQSILNKGDGLMTGIRGVFYPDSIVKKNFVLQKILTIFKTIVASLPNESSMGNYEPLKNACHSVLLNHGFRTIANLDNQALVKETLKIVDSLILDVEPLVKIDANFAGADNNSQEEITLDAEINFCQRIAKCVVMGALQDPEKIKGLFDSAIQRIEALQLPPINLMSSTILNLTLAFTRLSKVMKDTFNNTRNRAAFVHAIKAIQGFLFSKYGRSAAGC